MKAPASLLIAAILALLLTSLAVGAGDVGLRDSLHWLLSGAHGDDAQTAMVLGELRLPRMLKALSIGSALAVAGVLLQTITRNPLAETGLLGVNGGAAFAVAAGIAIGGALSPSAQVVCALCGALAGSALVLLIAHAGRGSASPLRLVLAGIALSASCQSLTAWATLGRAANLDQFRFWLLGSLSHPPAQLLAPGLLLIAAGLLLALMLTAPLGALGLGDDLARSLGHRPALIRASAIGVVAVLAGTSVALAGPIAFLGLIAPYLARAIAGVSVGAQLLYSSLIGAALLLLADLGARLIVAPFEAPVSALIALIGAPLLIRMVRRDTRLSLNRIGAEA